MTVDHVFIQSADSATRRGLQFGSLRQALPKTTGWGKESHLFLSLSLSQNDVVLLSINIIITCTHILRAVGTLSTIVWVHRPKGEGEGEGWRMSWEVVVV